MTIGHTEDVSTVLGPGIRTFKPRRSRITQRQQRALDNAATADAYLTFGSLDRAWSSGLDVVMDIGFGSAEPVLELARTFPQQTILAIDVHTPGIGDLIDRLITDGVGNVFVIEGDALEILTQLPGPLAGIRSFFPDPWPKKRHHKRRLIQPAVLDAATAVIEPGGFWQVATDWGDYADAIASVFDADERWRGGVIEKPPWRPTTHFERRAIREGRPIVDMWFERN